MICGAFFAACVMADGPVHTTYLWHQHQPVYWPKSTSGNGNGYEKALDTINNASARGNHPTENLGEIFGKDDRVAVYQYRMKDAVSGMNGGSDRGAQATMSGSLMQDVHQLGVNNTLGYSPAWTDNGTARSWLTSGGKPRLDLICIPAHHPIAPFCHPRTLQMDIRVHRYLTELHYGTNEPYSKGFYPPEMCFSPRIIPTLAAEGFNWVAVANNHISRCCPNFPYIPGSGGELCDPPNKADQLNPDGSNWFRKSIERGCSPVNAVPFAVQPHYVRQYDPHSGEEFRIIAVPAEMALSWDDGYSAIGTGNIDSHIAPYNDPVHPCLVMMCHDGDNAYGGGYSYYHEAVPNFTAQAAGKGYSVSTVEQYLHDYPVDSNDVIYVEDGGWVNADGDFGSPFMLNWTWFLWKDNKVDIENGWHYKLRDYAIRMAALNWVLEAEMVAGHSAIDVAKVAEPYHSGASSAEKAWHFYLGSLDSGFQYYGNPGDNEIRVTIACNEAYRNAQAAVGANPDQVGPSVWIPQRYPWNPGGQSFGPQNYDEHGSWGSVNMGKDFYVWTFAYDRTGIQSIQVLYRKDRDGVNDMATSHNETFAGGEDVHAWQTQAMTDRGEFPKQMDGFGGLENITYELPEIIAHHYWTEITTETNTLYDYAIIAVDYAGNASTSDIFHVYVGSTESGGGEDDVVTYTPDPPVRGTECTITYDSSGRNLSSAGQVYIHLGFNNWDVVIDPDPVMTGTVGGEWSYTFFISNDVSQVDCVFNDGGGTWDNNNGSDWHVATVAGDQPPSASFNAYPRSGEYPLTVRFYDTSSGLVSWRHWDFGDGHGSNVKNPTNTYATAGEYSVMLIVSNQYGTSTNIQADYITVTVPGAPQAHFSASPQAGPPGTVVSFTDQSSGAVTNWTWNFGDGHTATNRHPQHEYTGEGQFDVSLIVSGPAGASTNSKTGYITISEALRTSVDGTNILADFSGAECVLQDTPTGESDAVIPGSGSELDALYITNTVSALTVGITGNLLTNGNCLVLFIDSAEGGTNLIAGSGYGSSRIRAMSGVVFDDAFAPDYAVIVNAYNGEFYLDFEQMGGTEKDGYYGTGSGDIFVSRKLEHGNNGFRAGFNNSNTGGVTAVSVDDAATADTGWEFELPWNLIDVQPPAAGTVKVQTLLTGPMWEGIQASRRISNQSLPGVSNNTAVAGVLGSETMGMAVAFEPYPPVPGQQCVITYDSAGRPLENIDPVHIHLGFNNWDTVVDPDPVMTGFRGGTWTYTIQVSNAWRQIDCVFTDSGGTTWDNNNAKDWHATIPKGIVTFSPDPPRQGELCTIVYNSAGRPLTSAGQVYMHLGFNGWDPVVSPDILMAGSQGGAWSNTFRISNIWYQVDCVFNDGASTWDNNGSVDWHRYVSAGSQDHVGDYSYVPGEQYIQYSYDIIPEPGMALAPIVMYIIIRNL
jgi:PKD repeat protein